MEFKENRASFTETTKKHELKPLVVLLGGGVALYFLGFLVFHLLVNAGDEAHQTDDDPQGGDEAFHSIQTQEGLPPADPAPYVFSPPPQNHSTEQVPSARQVLDVGDEDSSRQEEGSVCGVSEDSAPSQWELSCQADLQSLQVSKAAAGEDSTQAQAPVAVSLVDDYAVDRCWDVAGIEHSGKECGSLEGFASLIESQLDLAD